MAAAKKTTGIETVTIKPIKNKFLPIRIVGDSPLIIHAWDEKAKRMMLETQTGAKKIKKHPEKMPFDDFARSLHWITPMPTETVIDRSTTEPREVVTEDIFLEAIKNGAKFGFPANSIKLSGNAAAYRMGWVKNQMELRTAYFINSEYGELAEIKGSVPELREDMVKVGMGSADIRYRAMFNEWYMDVTLQYNESGNLSLSDIISVINAGGYGCGLGEWRPERDGIFGRYHVEMVK